MFTISQKVGDIETTIRIGYSHPKSEGNGLYLTSVNETAGRRNNIYYTNTGYVTEDLGSIQNIVTFSGVFPIWSNLKQSVERNDRFPERTVIRREKLDAEEDFNKLFEMQYHPETVIIQEKIGENFVRFGGPDREWRISNIKRQRNNYTLGKFNYLTWTLTLKSANDHITSTNRITERSLDIIRRDRRNDELLSRQRFNPTDNIA